jgi:hypothetical protein
MAEERVKVATAARPEIDITRAIDLIREPASMAAARTAPGATRASSSH